MMAEAGDPVTEVIVTIGFDQDGRLVRMTKLVAYTTFVTTDTLILSDFDSTEIGPMPEATNTFEEMEEDMQVKFDAMLDESGFDAPADAADSEEAPAAK